MMDLEKIINKYPDSLNATSDLLADKEPSIMFYILINLFGYLLKNDPEKVLSKRGIEIRCYINIIIKKFGKLFLSCPQIIENRNVLKDANSEIEDKNITLPDTPVIWVANHSFKDDVLASVLAAYRHTYILFGSLPNFFGTFDGITAWLNGVVLTNRKVANSRKASIEKSINVLGNGTDLLMFPEGTWNKTPNKLLLDFFPGVYRIAKETGAPVVPIIHYCEDPTNQKKKNKIHTVICDPIKIDDLSEKDALELLREVMGTWYFLLMQRYGQITREKLLSDFDPILYWEEQLKKRVLTTSRYDKEIELSSDFRNKNIILPEDVFAPVADLKEVNKNNIQEFLFASNYVKQRQLNDYQRRF